MKKIIVFLISIALIFMILAAFSLLLPSRTSLTKSIAIDAPGDIVHRTLSDIRNWPGWFPLLEDSSLNIVYGGQGTSAIVKDDQGRSLHLQINKNDADTLEIAVTSKPSVKSVYQFLLIPKDSLHTQVVFNVNTSWKWYPWEKVKGMFSDKVAGPVYHKALIQLKRKLEAQSNGQN